jgi:hypothetical protein
VFLAVVDGLPTAWLLESFLSLRHEVAEVGMKTANTKKCGGFHFPAEKSYTAKYAA